MDRAIQDFLQSPAPGTGLIGTSFATENGFEPWHIQQPAGALNEPLIDLIQAPPIFEDQVAAVFKLARAIGVAKIGALLFIARQAKAQASRVDPTVTDLGQLHQAGATG